MHKSRLGVVVIDCQTDDLAGAAAFWGGGRRWAARPRMRRPTVMKTI